MRDGPDLAWLTARPVAHRGYHAAAGGRIENTLPAFETALARNFAIECDVREAAGGDVIVFHDDTLDRLTEGTGLVAATSVAELRAMRFRAGGDVRIPTLEELLDLVDGRVPLVVEIKTAQADSARIATSVAETLLLYSGPVAVMSFEPATMVALRAVAPQLPRGMLIEAFTAAGQPALSAASRFALRHLFAAPRVLPQFTACDVKRLPASAPLLLRQFFGLPLLTWTVRNPADRAKARSWADQMIFEGFDPEA